MTVGGAGGPLTRPSGTLSPPGAGRGALGAALSWLLGLALAACTPAEPGGNAIPEVVEVSHAPDTAIVVGDAAVDVYVLAEDPDGDALSYTWALSATGERAGAPLMPDGRGSTLTLDADPALIGQVLTCYVEDAEDLVLLRWPLVGG